jgi:hypothetical protein
MRGATWEGAESRAYRFATETKKNTGTWSLGEMLGERTYHQERHIGFGLPTWSTEVNIYYSLARAISFSSERSFLTKIKTHSIYTRPIRDGYVVVDLGANVGQFTEETNKRFGCICYAVVPIPELYSQIGANESIHKYNFAIRK